jgi:hypothetical protein
LLRVGGWLWDYEDKAGILHAELQGRAPTRLRMESRVSFQRKFTTRPRSTQMKEGWEGRREFLSRRWSTFSMPPIQ